MKYHITIFGCQMNRSDAERLHTVLQSAGYEEAKSEDEEGITLLGLLACSVRQKAIDRVFGKINNWKKLKETIPLITFITGCILPADRNKFLTRVDLVFPIDQLISLPDMLRQYGTPTPASLHSPPVSDKTVPVAEMQTRMGNFWKVEPSCSSRVEAYVPIQNGCNKFCSFCAVPYTRGREVSRSSEDILAEVKRLVEQECKSITLLGQNVNSYGQDKTDKEPSFPQLMRAIGEIGKSTGKYFRVYFTSPHPRDFSVELLEVMAEYPVLAKWIHLPLQSGDNRVLMQMNRNHNIDRYRSIVADIRRILPEATLFTDIIVGFTGETWEQFQATASAMREFRYNMAYIACYSPRPGARSARWIDNIPRKEKETRFRILSDLLTEIGTEIHGEYAGKTMKVLAVGQDRKKGYLAGYTEGRIPVRIKAHESEKGKFLDVKIISTRPLSLEGERL